jgi:hypothetical protein
MTTPVGHDGFIAVKSSISKLKPENPANDAQIDPRITKNHPDGRNPVTLDVTLNTEAQD